MLIPRNIKLTKYSNFLSIFYLLGCASFPETTLEKINNTQVEYAMTQHNTIPIVFENGLGGHLEWWRDVLPKISKDSTTFVYNRPGIGNSEPVLTQREGEGSLHNQSFLVRWLLNVTLTNSGKEELNLLSATGEQVLNLPTLKNKLVIVLSASIPLNVKSKLADDANQKRKAIAKLYPGSKQIWVESGHGIPLEKPESIVLAIREAQNSN